MCNPYLFVEQNEDITLENIKKRMRANPPVYDIDTDARFVLEFWEMKRVVAQLKLGMEKSSIIFTRMFQVSNRTVDYINLAVTPIVRKEIKK